MAASLQAAQQMLEVCSNADDQAPRTVMPEISDASEVGNSTRKCKTVQFRLVPRDFRRLRRISEHLGWSRAELARRSLLLVMKFLEDQYAELEQHPETALEECVNAQQLSLLPELEAVGNAASYRQPPKD